MRTARVRVAIFAVVLGAATPALAQHEGHGTAAAPAAGVSPELVSTCVDSQRQTLAVMDAANSRVESARQTNSAAEIRAALADLQRNLLEARTALGRCTELQQALSAAPSGSARPAPASGDAAATTPKAAAAPNTAARHMVMVQTAMDPSKLQCPTRVDATTAAKTTYKGKTYYFCSAKDRDEFLTDPEMSLSMMPPKQ